MPAIKTIISPEFKDLLGSHMKGYYSSAITSVLDGEYQQLSDNIYHLAIASETFLNTCCSLNAYIFKQDNEAIFCLLPELETRPFSGYFPQMVPQVPWLSVQESDLPFPNLPAIEVNNIQWWYIYSTPQVSQSLADSFYAHDFNGVARPEEFRAALNSLIQLDEKLDGEAKLQGLFYFGTLPNLPEEDMIPASVKDVWGFVTDNIKIQGCVYYTELIPHLSLQIPILSPLKTFEGEVIKSISFGLSFSSPLTALQQITTTGEHSDDSRLPFQQKREAALTGAIAFNSAGGNKSVQLQGIWPLDDDILTIAVKTELEELRSYFDQSNILADIGIPTNIAAGIAFKISKEKKQLEAIDFNIGVEEWKLIPGFLTFKQLDISATIRHPGRVNLVNADFSAIAQLGAGNIQLLADGSYPNGIYNLYLNPKTPIAVADIVGLFSSGTGIENNQENKTFITRLSGRYNSATQYFGIEMAVAKGASLKADNKSNELNFQLDDLYIGIYGKSGGRYTFKFDAQFSYQLDETDTLVFTGSAEYDQGWRFSAGYNGSKASLKKIASAFGLGNVPEKLKDFYFRKLTFAFDSAAGLKSFGGEFEVMLYGNSVLLSLEVQKLKESIYFSGDFTTAIEGKPVNFNVEFLKQGNTDTLALQMLFNIAGVDIFLKAASDKSGEEGSITQKKFSGGTKDLNLSLASVLTDILNTASFIGLPAGFLPDIVLQDIFVSYNGETKETNLIALTAFEDHTVRFFIQYRSENKDSGRTSFYVLGMDADIADFSRLPLVGEQMQDVSLSQVGFIYTSEKGDYCLPRLVKNEEGINEIKLADAVSLSKGLTLAGNINLPPGSDKPIALILPADTARRSSEKMLLKGDGLYALAETNENIAPAIKWININKKMGPVAVSKLGFSFKDGRLSLLISGALMLADLDLSVEGLGLSFSLPALIKGDNIGAEFELNGLGLSLKNDPVELSGMLLRTQPTGDELVSFYGAAQMSTSGFSIKGIGAYAKTKTAGDSLFVYGLYSGPIGGPSFFFVTGIAAGFGYNRTVRIPKLEEVKDFPLVALALNPKNKSIAEILGELIAHNWIPVSAGDYWLALGIKFTSFNIVESFVLVTVNFGSKLEFAVIGLSLLKWPNKGAAIVYIELAILARFGPDSDVIAVTGMLTPNSYLFDKNCKLTGGFAFYSWVSGPHEGDFVITLGGYHPQFKKPDHYPSVDRLALNWKFSDELSLSGEMYFALTPNYLMAGGKWEVAYNLSFLSARVTVWADMFIQWAPFQYEITAGIIVRIEANIKVAFIHIHFKLQLACIVHIWGPDFAGEIFVDWTIFSFTIPFGAGKKKGLPPLEWERSQSARNKAADGFKESFVPVKDGRELVLDSRIVKGVMNEAPRDKLAANSNGEITFINSYNLVIAIDSFFPLHSLYTRTNATAETQLGDDTLMEIAGEDMPKTISARSESFGVKPMAIENVNADLHAWLTKGDEVVTNNVAIIANAKGVNNALWGKPDIPGIEPPAIIKNALSGIQLHTIETLDDKPESFSLDQYDDREKTVELLLGGIREAPGDCSVGVERKLLDLLDVAKSERLFSQLQSVGFGDLDKPEELVFDKAFNSIPRFFISIGERLPSKPI